MKKDLQRLAFLILPILVLVISTNYLVDPGNIFKTNSHEKQMDKALSSGYNIAFTVTMSQLDEVRLLKYRINAIENSSVPDILAIGSSRAFALQSSLFEPNSFYNASISSCKLGDLIAIFNLFDSAHLLPKTLIIGVDPDFFVLNPLPKENLTKNFVKALSSMHFDLSLNEKILLIWSEINMKMKKINELFSPAYFQDALKILAFQKFNFKSYLNDESSKNSLKMAYYATYESFAPGGVVFADGSRQLSNASRQLSGNAKIYNLDKQMVLMERIKSNSYNLRSDSIKLFESFINYLQKKKIKIIFLLVPEHTRFYNYEKSLHPLNFAPLVVEDYLIKFAAGNDIQIIGSYDVTKTNLTDDDLYDHHHPYRNSIGKLINKAVMNI